MKKIFIFSLLLIAVLASSGCMEMGMREMGTFVRAPTCNWVFKTNADYSNLIAVSLITDKSRVTHAPFFGASIERLDRGYYTGVSGCEYPQEWVIAFTNITIDEWERTQEECRQQIMQKEENDTEKESKTSPGTGPRQMKAEDTFCDSDLFLDLLINFQNYIMDDDPFTELYVCDAPVKNAQELNSMISSGELESACKRQV
jgi:hypothetical protein